MPPKKPQPKFKFPSWTKGALISVIVMPMLVFSWNNIKGIWAAPAKLDKVSGTVETHEETQDKLSKLILEQQTRLDKAEAVTDVQINALTEQLKLIAELKKK